MILIISNENDQSTCKVVDWLFFFRESYIIITEHNFAQILELNPYGSFKIQIDRQIINSSDIESIWYRRGGLFLESSIKTDFDSNIVSLFQNYGNQEASVILNFLNYSLLDKYCINNYLFSRLNKLIVLKKALKIGFIIPPTIITGNKKVLENFIEDNNGVITKNATEGLSFSNDDFHFYGHTELLTTQMMERIESKFFPSLFQKKIDKLFEIRAFIIDDEVFAMAIFSQSNLKTNIDFRNYDKAKPNRNIPFNLPVGIQNKAKKIMLDLNLNCCSMDFIYGKDKQFYFLEINPVGQFGMVSYPCNYYIEKLIAKKLKDGNSN